MEHLRSAPLAPDPREDGEARFKQDGRAEERRLPSGLRSLKNRKKKAPHQVTKKPSRGQNKRSQENHSGSPSGWLRQGPGAQRGSPQSWPPPRAPPGASWDVLGCRDRVRPRAVLGSAAAASGATWSL